MQNCNPKSPQTSIRWVRSLSLVCSVVAIVLSRETHTAYSFAPKATNAIRAGTIPLAALNNDGIDSVNNVSTQDKEGSRRSFLSSILSTTAVATLSTVVAPQPSLAAKRYVLDDETGDYIEQDDEQNWQEEWKSRYNQMSTMTKDEIFQAARGAGNVDLKDLENESPASRKRRAFNGCRDKPTRAKLGNIDEKSCTKRILEGDIDFVLKVL
eukprot:jgi/Psemu1/301107/fgenesh1_kg.26_\